MARSEIDSDERPDIAAAGGVVVRRDDDRRIRIAVVHRPKYLDWSLPKGKLERDEGWREAALREVREETGYSCEASVELPPVSYRDRKGRSKLVRYWLMEPVKGKFKPHAEVDELRWLTRREAEDLLSYEHDRRLLRKALRKRRLHRIRAALPGPAWRWSV